MGLIKARGSGAVLQRGGLVGESIHVCIDIDWR